LKRWYGSCGWSRNRSDGEAANCVGQEKDTNSHARQKCYCGGGESKQFIKSTYVVHVGRR